MRRDLSHLLLRIGLQHRIGLEREHAAELAGNAADLVADAGLSEQAADGSAKRLTKLADQVAEHSLRRELAHLLSVGLLHRIGLEGQHAAELAGDAAELAAEPGLTEQAADGAAERLAELADQVAEQSLWRELLHLLHLLQLLQLLLLRQLLRIGLHGVSGEGQDAAADAAGHLPDLATEAGIAEQPADAAPDQPADRAAQQAAEQALRRKLLAAVATPLRNSIHVRSCACKGADIFSGLAPVCKSIGAPVASSQAAFAVRILRGARSIKKPCRPFGTARFSGSGWRGA